MYIGLGSRQDKNHSITRVYRKSIEIILAKHKIVTLHTNSMRKRSKNENKKILCTFPFQKTKRNIKYYLNLKIKFRPQNVSCVVCMWNSLAKSMNFMLQFKLDLAKLSRQLNFFFSSAVATKAICLFFFPSDVFKYNQAYSLHRTQKMLSFWL